MYYSINYQLVILCYSLILVTDFHNVIVLSHFFQLYYLSLYSYIMSLVLIYVRTLVYYQSFSYFLSLSEIKACKRESNIRSVNVI